MTGKHVEVGVVMKDGRIDSNGHRADEAVDQLANGFSSTATETIEGSRFLVVRRSGGNDDRPGKQPAKITQVPFTACAGKHFHPGGTTDGFVTVTTEANVSAPIERYTVQGTPGTGGTIARIQIVIRRTIPRRDTSPLRGDGR